MCAWKANLVAYLSTSGWREERRAGTSRGNVGLVVGSTFPDELKVVRSHCGGMPILIPGVGAQDGDLATSVRNGLDEETSQTS